jgi:hypothetical protein
MIQRVQTIYLLFTSVLTGLTAYFDLAIYYSDEIKMFKYNLFGVEAMGDMESFIPGNWIVQVVLVAISTLLALFIIFNYKNRKLQLKLGNLNYLLLVAMILSIYFSVKNLTHLLPLSEIENLKAIYWIGFYMPVAAIAFQFLANRGIKKDEALVKSVERLRG